MKTDILKLKNSYESDSYGNPIELSFDDVEILQEMSDNIDWEQRRYELAKSAMQGYCIALGVNDDSETYNDIAIGSIRVADALIKELKKGD